MCWNYQKRCRILIKAHNLPSHFSGHLQELFFFHKLSLEYAFDSSNTKLKLLVILAILLLFGFGPQVPMRLHGFFCEKTIFLPEPQFPEQNARN